MGFAWAFERKTKMRVKPPLEGLVTDFIAPRYRGKRREILDLEATAEVSTIKTENKYTLRVHGSVADESVEVDVYVDGQKVGTTQPKEVHWELKTTLEPQRPECLGWDLKPLPPRKAMVVVVARSESGGIEAKLLWADYTAAGTCRD